MKKSFPVNINGTVLYIDEDAYELLNTYIDQLRAAFSSDEGKEIVDDIENRISEIFAEKINNGAKVIVLDDVNAVIEQMGRPAELSDNAASEDADAADNDNATANADDNTANADNGATPPPFPGAQAQAQAPVTRRLYRNENNKVFGGVLGGFACFVGWNTNILRLLLVVLALCTQVWPLMIVYLIAWMIIPPARTPRQFLEMTGTPVTVSNIGNTILGSADPQYGQTSTSGAEILSAIGKVIMGFVGVIAGFSGFAFAAIFIMGITGMILYGGWGDISIIDSFNLSEVERFPMMAGVAMTTFGLAGFLPCLAITWSACNAIFKVKSPGSVTIISLVVIEVLLIIATIIMVRLCDTSVPMTIHYSSAAASTALTAAGSSFSSPLFV